MSTVTPTNKQLQSVQNMRNQANWHYHNNMMSTPSATSGVNFTNFGSTSSWLDKLGNTLGSIGNAFGPLGSIAGGLANGLVSMFGQQSANDAMLEATRMTNEQNYRIWQEQRQNNLDLYNLQHRNNIELWNMQNEYNDPAEQVKRLERAGLNPYLNMGSNPTGSATNAPTSATAQPAQTPTMQTADASAFTSPLSVGIRDALSSITSISQAINLSSSNRRADQLFQHQITNSRHTNRNLSQSYNLSKLQEAYDAQTLSTRIKIQKQESDLLDADIISRKLSNQTQQVILSYLPQNQAIDYLIKCKQYCMMFLQEKINRQQLQNMVIDALVGKSSIRVNNSVANLNDSTAKYTDAKTSTENALRSDAVVKAGGEAAKVQAEAKVLRETANDIIMATISENSAKRMQYEIEGRKYATELSAYDTPVFGDLLLGIDGATTYFGRQISNVGNIITYSGK